MSAIINDPSYPLTNIAEPSTNDVMCGRGGGTNNHIGNRRFRMLVNEHKNRYLAATKLDKPKVAREVMIIWRKQDPPGRFLSKDGQTKLWNDVGDQKAREKASQCLRERRTPSDVLPFLMPGKKKKLQAEAQAGLEQSEDAGGEAAELDYDDGESSDECPSPPPQPKKRTLPRLEKMAMMQQMEKMQQLEKMQQELRLQEMMLLQQQQQQQQQSDPQEQQNHRVFPRQAQLARAQTLPTRVQQPQPNTPIINNLGQMNPPQNVESLSGMNSMTQKPTYFQRQLTAPCAGWDQSSGTVNGNGANLACSSMGANEQQSQQYHATTAAATTFRMDLNQKYGFAAPSQEMMPPQSLSSGLEPPTSGISNADNVPSHSYASSAAHACPPAAGAHSAFSSMRSLEFEDLKEWADISSRSLGLGASQRNLGVLAAAATDDADDDNMDWMKSFKSLSSTKDAPGRGSDGMGGNSFRHIINAVDENNAFQGVIQPLGFNIDEQSQQSWGREAMSKNSRRAKMMSAKKLNGTSTASMMSELTDLSADLVALDLAAMAENS